MGETGEKDAVVNVSFYYQTKRGNNVKIKKIKIAINTFYRDKLQPLSVDACVCHSYWLYQEFCCNTLSFFSKSFIVYCRGLDKKARRSFS
jgi:hypothetical protein